MSDVCVTVDGHDPAHRARYTQAELRTARGEPSGVVHGSLTMLRSLLTRFNPAGLVVGFDGGRQEKTSIDPTYKANRKPLAPALTPLGKLRGTPGLRGVGKLLPPAG